MSKCRDQVRPAKHLAGMYESKRWGVFMILDESDTMESPLLPAALIRKLTSKPAHPQEIDAHRLAHGCQWSDGG